MMSARYVEQNITDMAGRVQWLDLAKLRHVLQGETFVKFTECCNQNENLQGAGMREHHVHDDLQQRMRAFEVHTTQVPQRLYQLF